jgi:catechol 2,3-dioxygenase-like lactoylglutathione lyase family enzyme
MIEHVVITISNFAKSKKFYDAALAPAGYRAGFVDKDAGVVGYVGKDGTGVWLTPGKPQTAQHVALGVATRGGVKKFYDAALKAGGRDNGAPGPRPQYTPDYYAAFVYDPDGHNIEAVTHNKR